MKRKKSPMDLGKRERQIMTFVYRRGEVTAAEVLEGIANAPGYSGVRAMLRILEEKGYLRHEKRGNRYVYMSTQSSDEAGQSAMQYTVQSFYGGSARRAMAALVNLDSGDWTEEELDRFEQMIEQARREGK